MISEVQICNMAVGHIGVKGILSLEENHETARKCKLYYSLARDGALRDANWNFATSFAKLTKLADSIPGWEFLYAKPSNCLKVRKIFNEAGAYRPMFTDFRVVHAPILNVPAVATSLEFAWAEITYATKDPNVFDAKFVEYLSYKLASMLAVPLTGKEDVGQGLASLASRILSDSRFANATEGSITPIKYSPLIESRS